MDNEPDIAINNSPLIRCSFITQWNNKKATFCQSVAHEGIATVDGDEDDIVFYCSHHRRVVEAKRTLNLIEAKYLKDYYDLFQPDTNIEASY